MIAVNYPNIHFYLFSLISRTNTEALYLFLFLFFAVISREREEFVEVRKKSIDNKEIVLLGEAAEGFKVYLNPETTLDEGRCDACMYTWYLSGSFCLCDR